jgi:hypothetical protein
MPWATPVEHEWPHEAQLSGSPVVSTHVPLQSVGVAAGHPDAHAYVPPEAAHTGVPPLHPWPQAPQLVALVSWTHAPLQAAYPASHANVHALLTHTGTALATAVVHAWPHVLQLFASLVGSTQLPLQAMGAAGGHPETHEYEPAAPAHTGVPAGHVLPQLPQLAAVVYWTQAPEQRLKPSAHTKPQVLAEHEAAALPTVVVHAWPQPAQFAALAVMSTQPPSHEVSPVAHPPSPPLSTSSWPTTSGLPPLPPSSVPGESGAVTSSDPPSVGEVKLPSGPGPGPPWLDSPDAQPIPATARASIPAIHPWARPARSMKPGRFKRMHPSPRPLATRGCRPKRLLGDSRTT